MTPQERKLVDELFERLRSLENAPRDPDAIDAINQGLDKAPNALYPLVQSVLVQDEALKRADARIRELEAELGIEQPQAQPQGGFLGNMRDALLGKPEQRGSVPSVRAGSNPNASGNASGNAWGPAYNQGAPVQQSAPIQPQQYGQPQYGQPMQQQSGGGSFLGTAAATVAGVVGGALLMNSFKGMFGGQQPGQSQSAFDQPTGGAPWGAGAGNSDLARQAGLDDIGNGGRTAAYNDPAIERTGLFGEASDTGLSGSAPDDADDYEDAGYDDGGGDFGGGND
jgi:hypothetical protein